MGLNRYDAKRDENEPEIVQALEKAGYFVTRLNTPGVPDLLVIKPSQQIPVHTCETPERALAQAWRHDITLLEIKMPGKDLNKKQKQWHGRAKNADT